jgi:hypothetical protein
MNVSSNGSHENLSNYQKWLLSISMDYWIMSTVAADLCDKLEERIAELDQRVVRPDKRLIAQSREWVKRFGLKSERLAEVVKDSRPELESKA